LLGFERCQHQRPGLGVLFLPGQIEHAVAGNPELSQRPNKVRLAPGIAREGRQFRFQPNGIVQIFANPVELRRPRVERIRLISIQHVAHGEAESAQIVLHAKKLQGILPVAVDGVVLELAKPRNLAQRVQTESPHDREHDREPGNEPASWILESFTQQCLIIASGEG